MKMASGSEDEVMAEAEEGVRTTRATRAQTARRGKKAAPTRGSKARRGRASLSTTAAASGDSSLVASYEYEKSMEVEEAEQHNGNTMENGGGENVPELDDAPPPTIVQPSPVRTGLKLKSSVSEEVPEVPEIPEQQEAVDTPMEQDLSQFTVMDEANGSDDDASHDKVQKTEETGGTEPVSEDELPTQAAKELLDTEAVSDDELPATKPPVPEEIPDAEEVSEDELPPEKKRGASKSGDVAEDGEKEKNKETSKESAKRKLPPDGEYDPSSPTSENESDETPAKKAAMGPPSTSPKKDAKAKALPELEKYWKAVKDDPADFTGWTYLLQYVDQENDVDAAREAYDAFLSHYPYCYGYWRKFADYEKKRGNKEKCEEVFDRGLQAIPLSVDLWIHYLNYCRAAHADEEDFLREQYERAIEACGMEFRSDRLWESYIKWETENKRFQHVTALYDRLLATPTQGYNTHFESFQDHVTNNPPNKVLSVDEFLTIRQEVLQLLKTYDQPAPVAVDDAAPPGEEAEAPPGEESEEVKAAKSDEETTALRERIIAIRRKIHKNTVNAVLARWNYEEGIKRPYFHVKPLERCQLKNWKEYLDYEIEQGDTKRTIVLFERCLIACALYEEFWIKFVKFLQTITEQDYNDKIRDVLRRACTIHHPKKPSLHLFWSEFEELQENYTKAAEVLTNIEKAVPGLLQISYRRINLERRRGNLDKVCELYEHYINTSKNRTIVNNVAIKYARFSWKIKGDLEKAISILQKALEKDKDATRLYLQLIVMEMERTPMNHDAVISVLDQYLSRDVEPEQKMMFAQRKLEFLEDFGTDIVVVQKAHDEFTNIMKQIKDKKKKSDPDGKGSGNSSLPPTSYPPPNYAQNGTFSAAPPPGGYQGTPPFPPTHGAPPGNYNQTYNQAYSQSGDYSNYQNWGYSQPGYSGYNQNWSGYYSY